MNSKSLLAGVAALSLAGCSTGGNVWSEVPNMPAVPPVTFATATIPLSVAPVDVTLPQRRSIGDFTRNAGCWVFVRQLTEEDFPPAATVTEAIRATLQASHATLGERTNLVLSGTVTGAHIDKCNNSFMETGPFQVDVELDIVWKLSNAAGQSVFESSTTGIGHSVEPNDGLGLAVGRAAGDAVNRLLQTVSMQQQLGVLSAPGVAPQVATPTVAPVIAPLPAPAPAPRATAAGEIAPVPPPAEDAILISVRPAHEKAKARVEDVLAAATVSLEIGGHKAVGSVISADGYVLAAADIAQGETSGTAALANGETVGVLVLRRDAANEAAFIKLGRNMADVPAIEASVPPLGAKIFAESANGHATGTIGEAGAGDLLSTNLQGVAAGSPILDEHGSLIGIAIGSSSGGTALLPIARAFSALHLGIPLAGQ